MRLLRKTCLFLLFVLLMLCCSCSSGDSDSPSALSQANSLPIISIYTQDHAEVLSRTEYVNCAVNILNCSDPFTMSDISAGIRVRGNSSAYYGDIEKIRENKAPYRIKFDQKQNLLGLNDGAEFKSWVLLKTPGDLIRDDITFRMGRAVMDDRGFCSDSTFVHLYINDEFYGIYLLCEQCQVNQNRVNIQEPKDGSTDTNTGYYLELDNYATSEPDNYYFSLDYARQATLTDINGTSRHLYAADYSVKSEITSEAQVDFISKYMNNLYTVLYDACINDRYYDISNDCTLVESDCTSAYQIADRYLDLDSVVNMYILYEIACDNDCGEGSFYMCIDFSERTAYHKLQFTSPWDFSWAYSGAPDAGYFAAAFCSETFKEQYGDRSNPWFILLMQEPWFVDMVRQRWTQLRSEGILDACLQAEQAYLLSYDAEQSFGGIDRVNSALTLLSWIESRVNWLDSQWLTTAE